MLTNRPTTETDGDEVQVAVRVAKRIAKRWGYDDWTEFLTPAWWGIRRAVGRGTPRRYWTRAGSLAVIDLLRVERPDVTRVRRGRLSRPPHVRGDADVGVSGARPVTLFDMIPAPDPVPSPEARRKDVWADTRRERADWTHLQRLWVYLWLVEGWSQVDVARAFDVSQSTVSQLLSRVLDRAGVRS